MNKCTEETVFKILWRLLGFKLKRKKKRKKSPTLTFQALPENEQMYSLFLLDIPLAVEGLGTYLFYICYLVVALKKNKQTHKTFHLQSNTCLYKNRLKIHKHIHDMLLHFASLIRKIRKFLVDGLGTMPLYGSHYSKLCCILYSEMLSSQNLNAVNNSMISYSTEKAINMSNQ